MPKGELLQPLFGMTSNLKPLYIQSAGEADKPCPGSLNESDFCKQSTVGCPMEDWTPAFVAWALTVEHIQTLLGFARAHDICVAVAGTGHDFLNRHSCDQGLLIRTALMKDIAWDHADSKGFGRPSVRVGAGLTFGEITYSGAAQTPSSYVSSGWMKTVGVTGWSLGGGHGPHGVSNGLGVDNLLEVEIVLSNGTAVVANKKQHADLFWALRGGGGSTWGVVTALTIRAWETPKGGFTTVTAKELGGSLCGDSLARATDFVDTFTQWATELPLSWNGFTIMALTQGAPGACSATRIFALQYVYHGSSEDLDFKVHYKKLTEKLPEGMSVGFNSLTKWWEYDELLEDLLVVQKPGEYGIMSSVSVARPLVTTKMAEHIKSELVAFSEHKSNTDMHHLYQVPGLTSPGSTPISETSISKGFREAFYHYVSSVPTPVGLYDLGEGSYFSESAYDQSGDSWKTRYWGTNYDKLLAIKKVYDPKNLMWCHHCVGSDLPRHT